MFTNLVLTLCRLAGTSRDALSRILGYKTPSAFQTVTTGKDLRLSVLIRICDALGYTLTIEDGHGMKIDLIEMYKKHADGENVQK